MGSVYWWIETPAEGKGQRGNDARGARYFYIRKTRKLSKSSKNTRVIRHLVQIDYLYIHMMARGSQRGVSNMSGSEITPGDETIVREYMAAYSNNLGLAQPKLSTLVFLLGWLREKKVAKRSKHTRPLLLLLKRLRPSQKNRQGPIFKPCCGMNLEILEDTEYLLNDLKAVWETFDLLIELFGIEDARK